MRHTWGLAAVLAVLAGITGLRGSAAAGDDGFVSLFNGKDLAGWKTFVGGKGKAAKTFYVEDGAIIVSGSPAGYFYTDKSYKNYVLRFDWRYKRPDSLVDDEKFNGNSGLLMHIQPPQKIWPKSIEVQGMNRNHGMLIPVSGAKIIGKSTFEGAALKKIRKPVGEWNTTEVTSQDGGITAKVNGTLISSGKGNLTEGPFGFQSEGAELHFKNIKIKVLD
jgi:hypothetical protein